jgi:L,D-transpeptidase YcbB
VRLLAALGAVLVLGAAAPSARQHVGDERPQDSVVAGAYARCSCTLLWVKDGKATSQARAVLETLRDTERFGLRASDYGAERLVGQLSAANDSRASDSQRLASFDRSLAAAAAEFLSDLHFGRIDPRAAGFELGRPRPPLDIAGILVQLAASHDVEALIASAEPPFLHYRLLKKSLQRYRGLAAEGTSTLLPPLPRRSVHVGESYAGVPILRRLLRSLGDLEGARAPSSTQPPAGDGDLTFDPRLALGLQHFQTRHGLKADGAIGRSTFQALTTPLTQRVRQIELTLERWRWLPEFDSPPIIVNVPQFRLFAFRSTRDIKSDILQMNVIVGRTYPAMRTPIFVADMKYVIFRPSWGVPSRITTREMLPQIRANPAFLGHEHLEIVRNGEETTQTFAPTDSNLASLAAGQLRLRQQPGPDNALGLVKFALPNDYGVYLHSTPAQSLFGASTRAFSHGCIRVSDPVSLAEHVLHGTPGEWTPANIQAAMNGTETVRVNLAHPVRVMVLYGTVLATEDGQTFFFDDIYGHDRKLQRLLASP